MNRGGGLKVEVKPREERKEQRQIEKPRYKLPYTKKPKILLQPIAIFPS